MVQAPEYHDQIKARFGEGQALLVAHQAASVIGHEICAQISVIQRADMAFIGVF